MLKGTMKDLSAGKAAFKVYQTGAGPTGVVMIHEWWGLTDGVKRTADELALLGLRVLAVDLYDGKVFTDAGAAGAAMQAMDMKLAVEKCAAAIDAVGGNRVGTIGWCMGGGISLQASLARPEKVAATCIYYGMVPDDPKLLAPLKSVLGIFARKDGWITPHMAQGFERALTQAGVNHATKIFDADHAFANPSNERHDGKAAAEAWRMTTDFFREKLLRP